MAIATLYQPIRIPLEENWFGFVSEASANRILITDINRTAEYTGNFTYGFYGDVFGTVTGLSETRNGAPYYSITDLSVDANELYYAVQVAADPELVERILFAGADTFYGSDGDDELRVFAGDNFLFGMGGDDTLIGGSGNDIMEGGGGANQFFYTSGNDEITDFQVGIDTLEISLDGLTAQQIIDFAATATLVEGNPVIDFGGGNTLTLHGLSLPEVTSSLTLEASDPSVETSWTIERSIGDAGAVFTVERDVTEAATPVYVSTVQDRGAVNSGVYTGLENVEIFFASGQATQQITVEFLNDRGTDTDLDFSLIVQADSNDPINSYLARTDFTVPASEEIPTEPDGPTPPPANPPDEDGNEPEEDPGEASPVDTSPLSVLAPSGWVDDGGGGVVNAAGGAVFLGHSQGESALLRVENGTVVVSSSGRVTVDGDVYAVRGGPERPIFSGSFAVEPGTLSATGFSPRSDGYGLLNGLVDIDFSRLTFSESDVALGADLDFPAPFDALDTAGGPLALRFGADGLSFGPDRVGTSDWLPEIELPLSAGSLIDLTFSDMGVDYDGLSDSLYFSGAAKLVWGGTIKEYFDGLAFVPLQDLEFDLSGERTGDALFERGDKFLRLQHQDGDLAWDIVGDVTYSSTAGFLRELSLGLNSIDETFSGSITGAFSFASERTVTGELSGLWDPIAIDSVSFGMDGLDLPVASTGLFLQGGSLGVDGLADGGSGGQSYSGKVDYTYGSAAGGLPTPIRGDIDGSFETGSVGGGFSIRSTPGYILGDATSGGIVDVIETYFGVDPSAVLGFELLDASGEIEANFARDSLYAELNASVLGGLFDGEAELTSFTNAGVRTIDFGARGAVQTPDAIPFGLGGLNLADANVAMEYSADQDFSNDFFAAWGSVGPFTNGFQVSFDGDFEFLNRTEIEKIGSWELGPENEVVLISAQWKTVREGAELVVITPDGTRLSEADLAAHDDIAIAEALTTPTSRHVVLETPEAGIWDIEMVNPDGLGDITYSASEVLSGPSLDLGITSDDYAAESAQLTLTADGMAAGSEIVINALANRDDAAGTRLQIDALQSGDGTQTVTWDYADFDPGIYHLEAVARGGGLAPEAALAETTVTVDALIEGAVTGPGGIALPDTALRFSVDGVEAGTAQTDAQGGFSLRAPPEIAGEISLERAVTAEERDGITASDALETLRLAVGLDPSWGPADGFDFVAADFNADGAVTASDALDILRIAVGLDTGSNQPRWVFGDLEADDVNANTVPNLDSQIDITALTADAQVNAQGVLVGNMEDYIV
ncbi:calcium-binding protein [Roseovarius tibetensis]|uniref:calcium-binding protein n=1 Tax=Roseovarius tibetensis TaxID=2685897 RepID=UPI003D7FEA28